MALFKIEVRRGRWLGEGKTLESDMAGTARSFLQWKKEEQVMFTIFTFYFSQPCLSTKFAGDISSYSGDVAPVQYTHFYRLIPSHPIPSFNPQTKEIRKREPIAQKQKYQIINHPNPPS